MEVEEVKVRDWLNDIQNLKELKSEIISFKNHFEILNEKRDSLVEEIEKNLISCYREKIKSIEEEEKFKLKDIHSFNKLPLKLICSNQKQFLGFTKQAVTLNLDLLLKNPDAFCKFAKYLEQDEFFKNEENEFFYSEIVNLFFCDFIHPTKGVLRFLHSLSRLIEEEISSYFSTHSRLNNFLGSNTFLGKVIHIFLNTTDCRAYAKFLVKPIISKLEMQEQQFNVDSSQNEDVIPNLSFSINIPIKIDPLVLIHNKSSPNVKPFQILNIIDNYYDNNFISKLKEEKKEIISPKIGVKEPRKSLRTSTTFLQQKGKLFQDASLAEISETLIKETFKKLSYMPGSIRLLCKLIGIKIEESKHIQHSDKNRIIRKILGNLIFHKLIKNQWINPEIFDSSCKCLIEENLKSKLIESFKWCNYIILGERAPSQEKEGADMINKLILNYNYQADKYFNDLIDIEYPNLEEIGNDDEIQISSISISLQGVNIINKIINSKISDFIVSEKKFGTVAQRLNYYLEKEKKGNPSETEFHYENLYSDLKIDNDKFKKSLKYLIINDITFKETKLDSEILSNKIAIAFHNLLLYSDINNFVENQIPSTNESKLNILLNQMALEPQIYSISSSYSLQVQMLANYILLYASRLEKKDMLNDKLNYFLQTYKEIRKIVEEKSLKIEKEINLCNRLLSARSQNIKESRNHFLLNYTSRKIAQEFIKRPLNYELIIEIDQTKKSRVNIIEKEKEYLQSNSPSSPQDQDDISFTLKITENKVDQSATLASAIFLGNNPSPKAKLKPTNSDCINSIDKFIEKYSQFAEIQNLVIKNNDCCKLGTVFQDFIKLIEKEIESLPIIKAFPAELKENTYDQIENYVVMKLYNKIFPSEPSNQDKDLSSKMEKAKGYKPEFFDVKVSLIQEDMWEFVKKEILDFDIKITPSQKLKAIVNASKTIGDSVKAFSQKNDSPGADDMIPILIYCIVKSQPKKLSTNLNFIKLFRNPNRIAGESEYCLRNMYVSQGFIFKINELIKNPNNDNNKVESKLQEGNIIVKDFLKKQSNMDLLHLN